MKAGWRRAPKPGGGGGEGKKKKIKDKRPEKRNCRIMKGKRGVNEVWGGGKESTVTTKGGEK